MIILEMSKFRKFMGGTPLLSEGLMGVFTPLPALDGKSGFAGKIKSYLKIIWNMLGTNFYAF